MPIRPPNINPPFRVVRIAYVDMHASNLEASKAFWVDALGFIVTEETADALYLRGLEERNHHSVVLRKAADLDVTAIGFKVFSEDDLDLAAEFCAKKGLPHRFVERPYQGRTLAFSDPLGTQVEFF
jgi:catechol 2,3-dioxygenase